jgi:GMP synthase (glutamine-hydrolysing)
LYFVNNGFFAERDFKSVHEGMGLNVKGVDPQRFYDALAGVTDPELKKSIGNTFIEF